MDDYRRRIEGFEDESDLSLNVMVLTHAKWPSFRENNMLAPDETSTPKKRRNVQTSASSRVDLPPDVRILYVQSMGICTDILREDGDGFISV